MLRNFGKVRRNVVANAIQWKIENDPFYADVQIDDVALGMLPDDDVPACVTDSVSEIIRSVESTDQSTTDENAEYIPAEHVGYVDFNGLSISSDILEKTGFANAILRGSSW
jgi:hypothetical protein